MNNDFDREIDIQFNRYLAEFHPSLEWNWINTSRLDPRWTGHDAEVDALRRAFRAGAYRMAYWVGKEKANGTRSV